jgi:hypothetical protein
MVNGRTFKPAERMPAAPVSHDIMAADSIFISTEFDMTLAHPRAIPSSKRRGAVHHLLALPALLFFVALSLAIAFVAYVLWPRWPGETVAINAPSMPISVAGVVFNIPPAAIRNPIARKPGSQERIDLVYLWPSLDPPDPAIKLAPSASPLAPDRIFMTIAASDGTLPPAERLKTIYPRYLEASVSTGPGGLALRPFREGSPYQGEELLYDPQDSARFLVRCTRNGPGATLGICLYERRIASADVTLRFPHDWLNDWRNVASGLERVIASLRASAK